MKKLLIKNESMSELGTPPPGYSYLAHHGDDIAFKDGSVITLIGGTYIDVHGFCIGDISSSILSEAQYQSIKGSGWVLADGRDVTGSSYSTLTGVTSIPDLRGQFLRGLDPSGTVDPDGATRTLGDTQADADQRVQGEFGSALQGLGSMDASGAFSNRLHTQPRVPASIGSGQQSTGWDFDNSNVIRTADETRPKNISVNFFVKINN